MTEWRVLVADDEPYVVLAIAEVLEGLPATVMTAPDGEEALKLARGAEASAAACSAVRDWFVETLGDAAD